MTNVLVEGGGHVLGSFLDAGQVDAVDVFIAPILEGGDHARTAARGRARALMSEALRLRASRSTGSTATFASADVYPSLAHPGGL